MDLNPERSETISSTLRPSTSISLIKSIDLDSSHLRRNYRSIDQLSLSLSVCLSLVLADQDQSYIDANCRRAFTIVIKTAIDTDLSTTKARNSFL